MLIFLNQHFQFLMYQYYAQDSYVLQDIFHLILIILIHILIFEHLIDFLNLLFSFLIHTQFLYEDVINFNHFNYLIKNIFYFL